MPALCIVNTAGGETFTVKITTESGTKISVFSLILVCQDNTTNTICDDKQQTIKPLKLK